MSNYLEGLPPEKKGKWLRQKAAPTLEKVGIWIDENIPRISPNHISMVGVLTSLAAAAYTESHASDRSVPTRAAEVGLFSLMLASDILDGAVARVQKNKCGRENPNGVIYDSINDSSQEAAKAVLKISSSHARGREIGEHIAYLSTVTTMLSGLSFAYAQSKGVAMSEYGGSPVGFMGSAWMRTNIQILSWLIPDYKNIDVQMLGDSAIAVGTTVGTIKNIVKSLQMSEGMEENSAEERIVAGDKFKALLIASIGTLGLLAALYKKQHAK